MAAEQEAQGNGQGEWTVIQGTPRDPSRFGRRTAILGAIGGLVGVVYAATHWDSLFPSDSPYGGEYTKYEQRVETAYTFLGEDYEGQTPLIDGWSNYQESVKEQAAQAYDKHTGRMQAFRQLYTVALNASNQRAEGLGHDQGVLLHMTEAYIATRALELKGNDDRTQLLRNIDRFIDTVASAAQQYNVGSDQAESARQSATRQLIGSLPQPLQAQVTPGGWMSALGAAFQYIAQSK